MLYTSSLDDLLSYFAMSLVFCILLTSRKFYHHFFISNHDSFRIKAIESPVKDDDTQWLTYWVVFALFNVIDFFSECITRYFPIYWFAKWVFLLYLHLPMTRGAEQVYNRFIRPFVAKHGNNIDQVASKISEFAGNARSKFEDHVKPN